MSAIPLGKGAFERIGAPTSYLVNMLYEQNPSNQEDQVSFLQRWGLVLFATCGTGPIRGIFRQQGTLSDVIIVVSGTNLYKVTTAGVVTQIGSNGAIPGTDRVSMAGNASTVLIANGLKLYSTGGSSVSEVLNSDSSSIAASSVAYISGYFLAAVASTHKVWFSGVGNTTFNVLNFFSAEFAPDPLLALAVLADFLHMIGSESTEVWVPTGNATTPFQRLKGRLYNVGTADKSTVVRLDNTLFWIGNDHIAYRLANQLQAVSDHGIDQRLRAATSLRSWSCVVDGHGLWIIATGRETLVYDVTTQQWSVFATYGLSEYRAHLGVQIDTTVIGADSVNGKLWTLTPTAYQDDGGPLVREWTGAIEQSGALARCDSVALDVTSGSATLDDDPAAELRVSDDLTKTWSDWRQAPLGRSGDYAQRTAWTRLGLIRAHRAFHFRTSANCSVTVRKARMNERF